MKAATLLYHDVIEEGSDFDRSGRPGPSSATFKLTARNFEAHLDAVRKCLDAPSVLAGQLSRAPAETDSANSPPVLLTFDDGGVSAHSVIADRLEARGWRGHFLVTSDYIGERGFLTAGQIRDLRDRGHVVGTHSASHPTRMSALGWREALEEWSRSREALSEILGEPVRMGSVPGGYYSRSVAKAAAAAGLEYLFTSEPTIEVDDVDGCLVLGRFALRRGSDPAEAAALARAELPLRLRRATFWHTKKIAKKIGGRGYLRLRRLLLE